jgi:hypothetical protein
MRFKSLARRRYESIFDSYDDPAEQQHLIEQRQVMKHIGRPEDIAMRPPSCPAMKPHSSPAPNSLWTVA